MNEDSLLGYSQSFTLSETDLGANLSSGVRDRFATPCKLTQAMSTNTNNNNTTINFSSITATTKSHTGRNTFPEGQSNHDGTSKYRLSFPLDNVHIVVAILVAIVTKSIEMRKENCRLHLS